MPKKLSNRLSRQRALFVKKLIDNPEANPVDIVEEVYNVTTRASASSIASMNLRNKDVMAALAEYDNLFRSAIVKVVDDWQDSETPRKREIALDAAKFGYEQVHGKATVKVETKSTVVKINIDLAPEEEKEDMPVSEIIDIEA